MDKSTKTFPKMKKIFVFVKLFRPTTLIQLENHSLLDKIHRINIVVVVAVAVVVVVVVTAIVVVTTAVATVVDAISSRTDNNKRTGNYTIPPST